MSGFNLPPGCSISDIPGNGRDAERIEAAEIGLMDALNAAGLTPDEYAIVLNVGLAAVKAARDFAKIECDNLRVNLSEEA